MKLIIAIIHDEDSVSVTNELTEKNFSVTKLSSTGGFLKMGNTTIIIGTEKNKVDDAIKIIKDTCKSRVQKINSAIPTVGNIGMTPVVPVEIEVGGATVFVVDVDRFEKV